MSKKTIKKRKVKKTTLQDVMDVISKWDKSNEDACFIGHFVSFDHETKKEEDFVKECRLFGYGDKDMIKIGLKDLTDEVKKEKSDFVNF